MTGNKKSTRKGKRELHGEDAQSLYLAGKDLEEIQELLPVALATLKRWHQEENGKKNGGRYRYPPDGWERP